MSMGLLSRLYRTIVLCGNLTLFISPWVIAQSAGAYQDFAFRKVEATVVSPYEMIHVSKKNAHFVQSYVQKELEKHGHGISVKPDMYVDLLVTLRMEVQATGGHVGGITSSGLSRGVSIYEVGTLMVQLIDVENEALIWQGSRTVTLWKKKEKRIRKKAGRVISRIFKSYDPSELSSVN